MCFIFTMLALLFRGIDFEITCTTFKNNFRNINLERTEIYLIEAAPRILAEYPEHLSQKAQKYLEEFGGYFQISPNMWESFEKISKYPDPYGSI